MVNKEQVETILKINGCSILSSEEDIRSVLSSARYTEEDIISALSVLHGKTQEEPDRQNINGLHRIFRTDEGLKPSQISKLLNIDVDIREFDKREMQNSHNTAMTQTIVVAVVAVAVAFLVVVIAMYFYDVGIFHPKATSAFNI